MKLKVIDIVGSERCIIREDGQKIYDKIHDELANKKDVTLDFDGMRLYASPFFNFAIGKLFKDIDPDTINAKLHIENINKTGSMIIKCVKENSNKYHNDVNYREVVDSILEQQAESME